MFHRHEITAKCACNAPETVTHEDASKRFLLPSGYYGGWYQSAGYYLAVWWHLRCEQCDNERQDFFVYKWHRDGSGSLVGGAFARERDTRRYSDVYAAVLGMLNE